MIIRLLLFVLEEMAAAENAPKKSGLTSYKGINIMWFLQNSGLEAIAGGLRSWGSKLHLMQRLSSWFSLSSFGGNLGNFTKDMIPFRQRGHGIEPGRASVSGVVLLVEQRQSAHVMQSSCPQPSEATVQTLSRQTAQRSSSSEAAVDDCNPHSLAISRMLLRGKDR